VLSRAPKRTGQSSSRSQYVLGANTFTLLTDSEFVYVCVSNVKAGSEAPTRFLNELRLKHKSSATARDPDLEASRDYARGSRGAIQSSALLKHLVEAYNSELNIDSESEDEELIRSSIGLSERRKDVPAKSVRGAARIRKVEMGLGQTAEIMKQNIGKVMQRGENIEALVGRTAVLQDEMRSFEVASRSLKTQMMWSSYRRTALIFLVLGVCLLVLYYVSGANTVASSALGWLSSSKKSKNFQT